MNIKTSDLVTVSLSLLAILTSILFINGIFGTKRDDDEPPPIPSFIPYFGHILGLFWHKNRYYTKLSAKCRSEIYSLTMPGARLYVVNSPELISSLQRQPKIASFWFIEAKFTALLGGMSKEASEVLLKNLRVNQPGRSLLIEGLKATHQAMMPGEELNRMIRVASRDIAVALDEFQGDGSTRRIDLWMWVRHQITAMTTSSVYGPLNPYRDTEVEAAFWSANAHESFADESVMLLTGIMPKVLAFKGYSGREKIVRSFEQYFSTDAYKSGSDLVKARLQVLRQDIDPENIARFECVNGIALLANTVPTAFWTIYHVFADRAILETVREHASTILTSEEAQGKELRTIDLGRLKEVPILTSIVYEALRHRGSGTGPRMVLDDIALEGRYLLKKDSYLIIPNHEMHFNTQTWGETAKDFDTERFLKGNAKKINPAAFRGFGGGANLCPGKAFATIEVVALVVMFALRYDMRPASGEWVEPEQDLTNLSLAIAPPKKKFIVDIVPRSGSEGGSWAFKL